MFTAIESGRELSLPKSSHTFLITISVVSSSWVFLITIVILLSFSLIGSVTVGVYPFTTSSTIS